MLRNTIKIRFDKIQIRFDKVQGWRGDNDKERKRINGHDAKL